MSIFRSVAGTSSILKNASLPSFRLSSSSSSPSLLLSSRGRLGPSNLPLVSIGSTQRRSPFFLKSPCYSTRPPLPTDPIYPPPPSSPSSQPTLPPSPPVSQTLTTPPNPPSTPTKASGTSSSFFKKALRFTFLFNASIFTLSVVLGASLYVYYSYIAPAKVVYRRGRDGLTYAVGVYGSAKGVYGQGREWYGWLTGEKGREPEEEAVKGGGEVVVVKDEKKKGWFW